MHTTTLTQSALLFERATRVIPGGIYGHMSPSLGIPGVFPYYASRAKGCRYWDVDDREYIDFMCGYGPIVLGYNHPEIEEAVQHQYQLGNCFNHPCRIMVDLAEHLVSLIDFAEWVVFGKNGSDMTTWAIQVAREFTQRKKVLTVFESYHGSHSWCTPGHSGLIKEDRCHIHSFTWNDLNSFHDLIKKYKGQIAAVICTPFHHPLFKDLQMPQEGFFQEIQSTCHQQGIIFILDDVRAGFRLHLGGSHRYFGFEPDMICFSKAIANGHPISAALGRKNLKLAASKVFLTGSFWNNAVPMVAALTCLKILERDGVIDHMQIMGAALIKGLQERAKRHGLKIHCSGPNSIPFLTFANEKSLYRNQAFCAEAVRRGVFFHPHHNWFISAAHQKKDIDQSLEVADLSFAAVREEFGG